MIPTTSTIDATLAPAVKNELIRLIDEGIERHERKKEACKTVYRRVCSSLEQELKAFNYTVPDEYTNDNGKKIPYNREVLCWYPIQTALSTLVRAIYQVDAVAKLPADKEAEIREFMQDTLAHMKALRESRTLSPR